MCPFIIKENSPSTKESVQDRGSNFSDIRFDIINNPIPHEGIFNVLLVDDNDLNLKMMEEMIE